MWKGENEILDVANGMKTTEMKGISAKTRREWIDVSKHRLSRKPKKGSSRVKCVAKCCDGGKNSQRTAMVLEEKEEENR